MSTDSENTGTGRLSATSDLRRHWITFTIIGATLPCNLRVPIPWAHLEELESFTHQRNYFALNKSPPPHESFKHIPPFQDDDTNPYEFDITWDDTRAYEERLARISNVSTGHDRPRRTSNKQAWSDPKTETPDRTRRYDPHVAATRQRGRPDVNGIPKGIDLSATPNSSDEQPVNEDAESASSASPHLDPPKEEQVGKRDKQTSGMRALDEPHRSHLCPRNSLIVEMSENTARRTPPHVASGSPPPQKSPKGPNGPNATANAAATTPKDQASPNNPWKGAGILPGRPGSPSFAEVASNKPSSRMKDITDTLAAQKEEQAAREKTAGAKASEEAQPPEPKQSGTVDVENPPVPPQATTLQKKKKKNASKKLIAHIGLGLPLPPTTGASDTDAPTPSRDASGQRKRRRTSDRAEDGGNKPGSQSAATRVQNTPSPSPTRPISPIDEHELTPGYNSEREPTVGELDAFNGLNPATINPVNRPPPFTLPPTEWEASREGAWTVPTAQNDALNWGAYIQDTDFELPQTQQPRNETPGYFEDPEMDDLIRSVGFPTLHGRTRMNDPQEPTAPSNQRHPVHSYVSQGGASRITVPMYAPVPTDPRTYSTNVAYPPPPELRTYARHDNGHGPRPPPSMGQEQYPRLASRNEQLPHAMHLPCVRVTTGSQVGRLLLPLLPVSTTPWASRNTRARTPASVDGRQLYAAQANGQQQYDSAGIEPSSRYPNYPPGANLAPATAGPSNTAPAHATDGPTHAYQAYGGQTSLPRHMWIQATVTPAPHGDWRPIQGETFYFKQDGQCPTRHSGWLSSLRPAVLASFVGHGARDNDPDSWDRMERLRKLLTEEFGVPVPELYLPNTADGNRPRLNSDPVYLLVQGITSDQQGALVRKKYHVTKELQVHFSDLSLAPSTWIGSFEKKDAFGPMTPEQILPFFRATFNREPLRSLTIDTIERDKKLGRLSKWGITPTNIAYEITIQSIRVRTVARRSTGGGNDPIVQLYCESPTFHPHDWTIWRDIAREQPYSTEHGAKAALIRNAVKCKMCHSVDHPIGLCDLPTVPGWNGPTIEEVTNWSQPDHHQEDRGATRGRGG
ncbi:hypothetical protein EVJ58_g8418, partial [Rhodofomes roseus]